MKLPRDLSGEDLVKSLRVGTLANIVADVGQHFQLTREDVLKKLFG